MSTRKPRMRYDSPKGVWICEGYYAETPLEAWGMWEQQQRIKEITFDSHQKAFKKYVLGDRSTQTESTATVLGIDLASPDQPDYTNVNYPKDSWLNVGIPNLVKKIKNWRGR